jgi:hypothetical protein
VLLSALWAYAPDQAADEDSDGDVDLLASGLRAEDDGSVLNHPLACGADLLVTTTMSDAPDQLPGTTATGTSETIAADQPPEQHRRSAPVERGRR